MAHSTPQLELSPSELLESLRTAAEDDSVRTRIEIQRYLAILEVLLPAALLSASGGNVTMRNAVAKILPLLPKKQ